MHSSSRDAATQLKVGTPFGGGVTAMAVWNSSASSTPRRACRLLANAAAITPSVATTTAGATPATVRTSAGLVSSHAATDGTRSRIDRAKMGAQEVDGSRKEELSLKKQAPP